MRAAKLYDADEFMADGGEHEMTAAEDVLAWLLIEKIGVPDDQNYTPNDAMKTIVAALDGSASELDRLKAKVEELEREVETQRELKKHARKCCDEEEAKVADLSARLARAVEVMRALWNAPVLNHSPTDAVTYAAWEDARAFLSEQENRHGSDIARCSPDNIRAFLEERSTDKATISALEAENKRLREAIDVAVKVLSARVLSRKRRETP
jgi:hypothetical protein